MTQATAKKSLLPGNLKVAIAQLNPQLGNIGNNVKKIIKQVETYRESYDLLVFPELCISGYPPEDLLLRPDFIEEVQQGLLTSVPHCQGCTVILGYPRYLEGHLYNCAGVIQDGQLLAEYKKQQLPNYQIFDEQRYFTAGEEACVVEVKGCLLGVLICEDIWYPEPLAQLQRLDIDALVCINASPYSLHSYSRRLKILSQRIEETSIPIIYANQVGGQDELVFDGTSMVLDGEGRLRAQGVAFEEGTLLFDSAVADPASNPLQPYPKTTQAVYSALVVGLRDYVAKTNFKQVLLGLSGGIDSALTLAIAVDAVGAEQVTAVMLPYRYTSQLSLELAQAEAELLGVRYQLIGLESVVDASMQTLKAEFEGLPADATEQNIQSRSRALLLMALSNKRGCLLLTTGNKSEIAVGYATLYGDMAGGYNVLKDVLKTRVYELAEYRNSLKQVIPKAIIERAPTAELAPGQKDADQLPPYAILDRVIEAYVELDMSLQDIVALGIPEEQVRRLQRMIDSNEYKRSQAAIGTRVTERGFGRDRRYPLANGWSFGK